MSDWLTTNGDVATGKITATPTQNTTGEDRLEVIKVRNYDGQTKLVGFQQLAGDPTYTLYVGNPGNGDTPKTSITNLTINSGSAVHPDTNISFGEEYSSGYIYSDSSSENINVNTTFDYTSPANLFNDTLILVRRWNFINTPVTPSYINSDYPTDRNNRDYWSYVFNPHTKYLIKDQNYVWWESLPEIFGPQADSYDFQVGIERSRLNCTYSNTTCSPGSSAFLGNIYAAGGGTWTELSANDVRCSDSWIHVTYAPNINDRIHMIYSQTGYGYTYNLTLTLDQNNTGDDREGYIALGPSDDEYILNIKQLANASDLKTITLYDYDSNNPNHLGQTVDIRESDIHVMGSPRFKSGEKITLIFRGQRVYDPGDATNPKNYLKANNIKVLDDNNNPINSSDIEFYTQYYGANEGCVDTPFFSKLEISNATTDLKIILNPIPYTQQVMNTTFDNGVEFPVDLNAGEVLPRSIRAGAIAYFTPILKKYNGVNIFKIDPKNTTLKIGTQAPIKLGYDNILATFTESNGTITVKPKINVNGDVNLHIATTIDEDAYEEAKPYPGPFNPDDTPEGDPWG